MGKRVLGRVSMEQEARRGDDMLAILEDCIVLYCTCDGARKKKGRRKSIGARVAEIITLAPLLE